MGRIRFGISTWSAPELAQTGFYPHEAKTAAQRLRYYSKRFSVAEIDSSYHFFPTLHNMELWLKSTPADFSFHVKAFSLLTGHPTTLASLPKLIRDKYGSQIKAKSNIYPHHLPVEAIDEVWGIFGLVIDRFQRAGKLGAVLFQFPPWFHPEPDNYKYIADCRKRLAQHHLAVEFRVGSWLREHKQETLEFLRNLNAVLVCVDEPQGFSSSVPSVAETTSDLAIIRFHGRNVETWEKRGVPVDEKFNYLYSGEELRDWVPRIRQLATTAEVHVIFKNKHADYPIRNVNQMQALLETSA
jgi:uncharacterized protein YecE (DUF72 family)